VENSYAVDNSGAGMSVSFTGSVACQSLLATDVYESSASTSITITPSVTGSHSGCFMSVTDKA